MGSSLTGRIGVERSTARLENCQESVQVDSEYMQRVMDNLYVQSEKVWRSRVPAADSRLRRAARICCISRSRTIFVTEKNQPREYADWSENLSEKLWKIMEEPLRGELIHRKIPLPLRWNFRWRKGRRYIKPVSAMQVDTGFRSIYLVIFLCL